MKKKTIKEVIENDRERKSSDFHVSFYYRG